MEAADVVLVNPPTTATHAYRSEHLGLAYLTAALRHEGYSVVIIDSDLHELTVQQTEQAILSYGQPKLIGVSMTHPSAFESASLILATLQHHGIKAHVTAGGYLSTFWYDKILSKCSLIDSIVLGEGDKTIVELARKVMAGSPSWQDIPGVAFRCNGWVAISGRQMLINDLDTLPLPARDDLRWAYQRHFVANVSTSRGCYYRCNFCQITEFYRLHSGPPWRPRSPENIVDEMETLERDYGVRHIMFVDDDFLGGGRAGNERAHAIADHIIRRGLQCTFSIGTRVDNVNQEVFAHLQAAGLASVFVGIESGVGRMLDDYAKRIDVPTIASAIATVTDLGIRLVPLLIPFDGLTTLAELKQTLQFFQQYPEAISLFLNELLVLRGTRIESTYRQRGLLAEEDLSLRYRYKYPEMHRFSQVLSPDYRCIYRPAAEELYRLYFLYGHFDHNGRQRVWVELDDIENRLKNMHLTFLEGAIQYIEAGERDGDCTFLVPLKIEGQKLWKDAQHLVEAWLSHLVSKGVISEEH